MKFSLGKKVFPTKSTCSNSKLSCFFFFQCDLKACSNEGHHSFIAVIKNSMLFNKSKNLNQTKRLTI